MKTETLLDKTRDSVLRLTEKVFLRNGQTSVLRRREHEASGSSPPEGDKLVGVMRVHFDAFPAEFTQKMIDAANRGLEPLGSDGAASTIYYLDKFHGVRLAEVFANPKRFLSALTALYGVGVDILEPSIAKSIAFEFSLPTSPTSLDLAVKDAVRQYKTHF